MKRKVIAIILFVTIMLSVSIPAFAENADLFYYDFSNEAVNECIENSTETLKNGDIRELEEQGFFGKDDEPDKSKITHITDEIFCEYIWSYQNVVDFFDTNNKREFLNNLEVNAYYYPMAYDGVRMRNGEKIFYYPPYKQYIALPLHYLSVSDEFHLHRSKEKLTQYLKREQLQEYRPLLAMEIGGNVFCYADKQGEEFVLFLYTINRGDEIMQALVEQLDDRVLTISQMKDMMQTAQQLEKKRTENRSHENGQLNLEAGSGSTSNSGNLSSEQQEIVGGKETVTPPSPEKSEQPQIFDEEQYPKGQPLLWVIGGAVVLVGGFVTIFLIVKKRQ